MDEKRLQVIQEMEARRNTLEKLFSQALNIVEDVANAEKEYQEFVHYYYGAWGEDFEASNRGEVPADMPHGVLSEDLPYEILYLHDELAHNFLEMAYKMLCLNR